jgi:hypothetical protein
MPPVITTSIWPRLTITRKAVSGKTAVKEAAESVPGATKLAKISSKPSAIQTGI